MDPYSTCVQDPVGSLGIRYPRGSLDLLHTTSHSSQANSLEVGTPAFLGQNVCPIVRHPQGGRWGLEMWPLDVIRWPGASHD